MKLFTKIAGFMHRDGAAERLLRMKVRTPLTLVREPDNPADPHAVRVEHQGLHLGYIPRNQARLVGYALVTGRMVRCVKSPLYFNAVEVEWDDKDQGDPILR